MKKLSIILSAVLTLGVLLPLQSTQAGNTGPIARPSRNSVPSTNSSSPCPTDIVVRPGQDNKYGPGEINVPMYTFDICFPKTHNTANINWVGASVEPNISPYASLMSLTSPGGNWLYRVQALPPSYTGGNAIYGWYQMGYPSTSHLTVPANQWMTVTISGDTVSNFTGYEIGDVCLTQINYTSANGSGALTVSNGGLPANVCSQLAVSN